MRENFLEKSEKTLQFAGEYDIMNCCKSENIGGIPERPGKT